MAENIIPTEHSATHTPNILMPLPDNDFDPTEASIPWKACVAQGWKVEFSTENGKVAQADQNKFTGPLPGLISAGAKARAAYQEMTSEPAYQQPIPYAQIDATRYDALLLPGGDGLRMKQYLESAELQNKVLLFWQQGKLVGAICHGVLVLARTIDPTTGRSVLYGRKVTAPPGSLDRLAYQLDRLLVRHGYIMYPKCVADEVTTCLQSPGDFSKGPGILEPYAVSDGNLVSARWYMDAELFASRFTSELEQRMRRATTGSGEAHLA